MRVNVTMTWDHAPAQGRFEFVNARYVGGGINLGRGTFSDGDFAFSFANITEPCRICFALDVDESPAPRNPPMIKVTTGTDDPFIVSIPHVLQQDQGVLQLPERCVTVTAEIDTWASL